MPGEYIEVPALTADKRRVFDLMDELRLAWERILTDAREPIPYIDGFMAVHNFHKLALDHIITQEAGLSGEAAARLFELAAGTFRRAMEQRAAQMRAQR